MAFPSTVLEVADRALRLDPASATDAIATNLRRHTLELLHRRGLVVAMSGGIDSSVCAALAVRAVGAARVLGLLLPERESSPDSKRLAAGLAAKLGIATVIEDITAALDAVGCYRRRNDAVRRVVPDFRDDWGCKILLPSGRLDCDRLNMFQLVVAPPGGEQRSVRLTAQAYSEIVAATNFKQRIRKTFEYFHADRLHYAVVGTPNRLEYDQGFFVKGGDGLADVKPIAHLYKTQVYQLAAYLGISEAIIARPPSTDTYSLPQTQQEFYFVASTAVSDSLLHSFNHGLTSAEAANRCALTPAQVDRAYDEFARKRATTRYLHITSLLCGEVPEISGRAEDLD